MPISIKRDRDALAHLNRHIKQLLNGDGTLITHLSLDQNKLPSDQTVVVSVNVIGDALRIQAHVGTRVPIWNNIGDLPKTPEETYWFALVVDDIEAQASKKTASYKLVTINNPKFTAAEIGHAYQTCVMMGVDIEPEVQELEIEAIA